MARFPNRVELLHFERLPRHLLGGAAERRALARARASHLRCLNQQEEFLQQADFPAALVEYKGWLSRMARESAFARLSDDDRPSACRTEHLVLSEYPAAYRLLNSSFFSLVALRFLSFGLAREEILRELAGQSWATKHEVLTRWGWMLQHRKLLWEGKKVPRPYSCRLSGHRVDREFYTYLQFCHNLRAATGEELLFEQKCERPDFVARGSGETLIGVEISHTAVSDDRDKEKDAEDAVLEAIREIVVSWPCHVKVCVRRSWVAASERLEELRTWLDQQIKRVGSSSEPIELVNSDLQLRITLSPCGDGPKGLSWLPSRPTTGSELERDAREFEKTLRFRIEKKLYRQRNGERKSRQPPAVRPCYLVLYPEHELGEYFKEAIEAFEGQPGIDTSSHFDQVWLSGEWELVRLC